MAKSQEQHEDLKRGQYRPTIFIGCGGTGAKILQRIRLQALERFGGFGSDALPGVAFISIDTDVAGVKAGAQDNDAGKDPKARTKKLCDFGATERINLDGSQLKHITSSAATLSQYPNIRRWFEPKMLTITNKADASLGAGQMRPLARVVAITNKDTIVARVQDANAQVKARNIGGERSKRVNGSLPVQVIIVAGTAGGTGAGIFLEVAAMVRDTLGTGVNIQGRFVLPAVFRHVDQGPKLQANGYACLKEINHYFQHPYVTQWTPTGEIQRISQIYDDVYVFDDTNLTKRVASHPAELYSTIGDTLFLDFFQGNFSNDRKSVLSNRHPVLMKTWRNSPALPDQAKWSIQGKTGGSSKAKQIAFEQYPRKFNSSGLARLCTPAWRLLNHLSYKLARDLLLQLDSRNPLDDEAVLKRDFAQRLGFYQGETIFEGEKRPQYSVVNALRIFPSEGNERAQLPEEITSRFVDLTYEDHIQMVWDEKNCGRDLRRRWDEMGAKFAGLRDKKHSGVYTKRIRDNKQALLRAVTGDLQSAIEAACEEPGMGPSNITEVMKRLVKDIKHLDVFWIKEMEKRAVQEGARAEELRNDWTRWSELASQADNRSIFHRMPAFRRQLEKAQESATQYWVAVADQYIYEQSAVLLREIADVLENEVNQQAEVIVRIKTMENDFNQFAGEYAGDGSTAVLTELTLPDGWAEQTLNDYLGKDQAERDATLQELFERTKRDLGIETNLALRQKLIRSKAAFARDLHHCCWKALQGKDDVTDWFGSGTPKPGLLVKAGFWDVLKEYAVQSERDPRLTQMATTLVEQGMPWASIEAKVPYHGEKLPLDMYVVLPKSKPIHSEYVEAFKQAVEATFKSLTGQYSATVSFVVGTEHTEVVCFAEIFALIPASLKSMHGNAGLAQQFQRSADKARDADPEGFLHTDVDTVQFDDLMYTGAQEALAVFEAWKLFLLGVMLQVIKSEANTMKSNENEANRIAPMFKFTFEGRGSMAEQPLGQYQTAVSAIQSDARVRGQLQDMVNREFIGQAAVRYEKLIGLAKYYKQCIFPIRRPRPDSGDDPVAMPAYVALTRIEDECLRSWQQAFSQGSPSQFASEKELVDSPRKLLWSLRSYAGDTGETPAGAAIKLGVSIYDNDGNYNYLEQPPAKDMNDKGSGADRLVNLKNDVFELLPPDLAKNGALRDQNPYFPWLALGPWWNVFLPSKHGTAPPDRKVRDALRQKHTQEMSTSELVAHFENVPTDGATERGGAQVWIHERGDVNGDWYRWNDIDALRDAVKAKYLELPEVGAGAGPSAPAAAPPVPGAMPAVPGAVAPPVPTAAPPMQYAMAGGNPESLTPDAIAARIQQAPAAQHYVLLNGAWTDAKGVPAVQQLLNAPPVPGAGGPALPPPPAAVIPPPPAALAPIPAGPFTYFVHGVHSNWVTVSGAELVDVALAQPAGQEGDINTDGGNVAVTDHPELSAALRDRRK